MRLLSRLRVATLLLVAPLTLSAQRGSSASTGGTGGRATGPGPRGEAPTTPPLPNVRAVTEGMNPADHLIDKKRKLKLDDAMVTSLQTLSGTINERYAPALARYDSLRTQVNMARNRMNSGMAPSIEEQQIARERAIVLIRTMAELRAQRTKDVDEALALLPEDKRAEGRTLLDEQAEDMVRSFRRSGPEGAAAAGGPPGGRRP
jgi:hypothetical protein